MAITQINTADYDYAMFLETLNKSYKGKADITISAFDTTAAPDVKVGSVFEDNGAIFIVDTSDITPTGYAGITNSTTFYLYYDESANVFIYSNTAPTWSDVLQGWYNGNDRAFFSMFKDSGGTLYQDKVLLMPLNNSRFDGYLKFPSKRITSDNYLEGSLTENVIFDKLDPFIPNVDDSMLITGSAYIGNVHHFFSRANRDLVGQIGLRDISVDVASGFPKTQGGYAIRDGNGTTLVITIAW